MTRFPLLEAMRTERARRDAEITAPVREKLASSEAASERLRGQLRKIESFLGSEISKLVLEQVGHEVGNRIRTAITEAIIRSGMRLPGDPVTITVEAETLRFSDPRLIEQRILAEYADRAIPRLRLCAFEDVADLTATTYDIRIPEFGMRHTLSN